MKYEGPSEEDLERFSREDTGYCPECGEEVWDDAPQCKACFRKQSFAIIGVIVLIAFFWGLWRFF